MPTYHACDITLRLGVASLSDTVTPDIVLRKGEAAKQQCEDAEAKLRTSELLDERQVHFPGNDEDFNLHWLGRAPFMQVQAGKGLHARRMTADLVMHPYSTYPIDPTQLGRLWTPYTNNDSLEGQGKRVPQALTLHVKLSNRAFISGAPDNQVHLKIEVLFNGQLSSCRLVPPHDIRSGAQSLHQIFSGHRLDFLAERPYVILPPGVTADGGPRNTKNAISVQERWKQISIALQGEADARGADKHGNAPPSAEFLYALSKMHMPDQVQTFQTPGGRRFGVIDVIITAGVGRKVTNGTSYLKAPQRLEDEDFAINIHHDKPEEQTKVFELDDEKQGAKLIDVGKRDVSNLDYLPESKRPALVPVSHTTPAPKFKNPFSDTQGPFIPSPHQEAPLSFLLSTSSNASTRLFSPQKRNAGHLGTHSSPMWDQASLHDDARDEITGHNQGSDSKDDNTPHNQSSFTNQKPASVPFCRTRPSPYSFPLLQPDINSPGDPIRFAPYRGMAVMSDPVQQTAIRHNMARSQHLPCDSAMPFASFPVPPDPGQYTAPTTNMYIPDQARQEPFEFAEAHPMGPVMYGEAPEAFMPSIAPLSSPFEPYRYLAFACPPPFCHRFPVSLPPAGLYSVPVKPGSPSKSSQKPLPMGSRLTDMNDPQSIIMVNRLVIMGRHGIILIDQRWSVPQRVIVQRIDTPGFQPSKTLSSQSRVLFGSGTPRKLPHSRSMIPNKSSILFPKPRCEAAHSFNASLNAGKRDQDITHNRQIVPSHLTSKSVLEISPLVEEQSSAISQRRTASRNNTSSTQGPKAVTYMLEDPEEVLREAKRLRRSRSPTKLTPKYYVSSQPKVAAPAEKIPDASENDSSSPLSSVPSTPEPELAIAPSPPRSSNPPSQFDGPSDRRSATVSPQKTHSSTDMSLQKPENSSPSKVTAALARRSQHQVLGVPQSLPSPSKKRYKFSRQPRSPDRLKTVDNPSLNRDCVISFAESENKESEKGVLRQVKGERQGVFQEDYVVFATRFFIAG